MGLFDNEGSDQKQSDGQDSGNRRSPKISEAVEELKASGKSLLEKPEPAKPEPHSKSMPWAATGIDNFQEFDAGSDLNLLKVDPGLGREIHDKNLEYRFIAWYRFVSAGHFHRNGWKPYIRDKTKNQGGLNTKFGVDADGFTKRGDLVLAVKPKVFVELQRERIKAKNRALNPKKHKENQAAELKEFGRKAGYSDLKVNTGE